MKNKSLFYFIIIIYIVWLIIKYCNTKINFPCFFQKQLSNKNKIFEENNMNLDSTLINTYQILNYPDILQFIYNIKNYRYFNRPEHLNIIENLGNFLDIYEDVMFNHLYHCSHNIDVAIDFAKKAQFHLDTIFLSLDSEGIDINKHKIYKYELENILYKYLTRMIKKCNKIKIISSNYNFNGPKARNYYTI